MSAAPRRVLVIDDEPPIRKLLRVGLSAHGYQIMEASSGKMALEFLGGQTPDLIVLDLGLPDMQGHELLRMIRARNDSVPIVVLSSRDDEAGKVQALDSGADDYVTKPFGMDELLARMRAALRHQLQTHGERPIFRVGDLSVDLVRRIVKLGDKDIKLSPKEYERSRPIPSAHITSSPKPESVTACALPIKRRALAAASASPHIARSFLENSPWPTNSFSIPIRCRVDALRAGCSKKSASLTKSKWSTTPQR